MTKVLTQRAVEAAKPQARRSGKPDGLIPGQQLLVYPSGRKTYVLLARVNGKQASFLIGDASLMALADARIKAKGILAAICAGEDPREAKQEKVRAAAETVEVVARRFIERYAKTNNRTWKEIQRKLDVNVLPQWGRRPVASITRRDVVALLDGIIDRGAVVEVNRVFAAVRRMFSWAVERDILGSSPCAGIKPPAPETKRDRVLSVSELALIWRAAEAIGHPFGPFVQILTLTGQRRAEVAGMRWSELNDDRGLWTIPAERVKNGIEHTVPLSPWAKAIIAGLPRLVGSALIFTTNGASAVSGYSRAKRRIDAAVARLNGGIPIASWTFHDVRRTVASGMARIGVQLPVIERILNHVSGPSFGGIAGVYQRYSFEDEIRAALERWAAHIANIVSGEGTSNVVSLRG